MLQEEWFYNVHVYLKQILLFLFSNPMSYLDPYLKVIEGFAASYMWHVSTHEGRREVFKSMLLRAGGHLLAVDIMEARWVIFY